MKRLIITADDLGISKSVNEGIAMAREEGILTYVSVLPSGDAYEDALRVIKDLKLKEIGAHLALTEMSAVSSPSRVPSLLSGGRQFNKGRLPFFMKFFAGVINPDEIYIELQAQLQMLSKTGIPITCLSGHEHIHMMPRILDIFITLAKEFNVPYIRYMNDTSKIDKFSPSKYFRSTIQGIYSPDMKRSLDKASIKYADNILGFIDSGLITEPLLVSMLSNLPDGTTEIITHPGFIGPEVLSKYKFHKNCEQELSALISPRARVIADRKGVDLGGFGRGEGDKI